MRKASKKSAGLVNTASILKVFEKYGAKKPKLFGSFARNEQTKNSDIDFLVEMPKRSSLVDVVGMKQDLEKNLRRKVDVVTYRGVKPSLRSRIMREAKPL